MIREPEDLVALIGWWARHTPNAPAIVESTRTFTYAELNGLANRMAARLIELGVTRETLVGVCLRRGAEMVAAQLAVWKLRGAYLPLDPAWPDERICLVLRDSGAAVVFIEDDAITRLGTAPNVTTLPGSADAFASHQLLDDPETAWSPTQLAYVIYTSGSTGAPKGVLIDHSAVSNLVAWHLSAFEMTARDRSVVASSPAFDASVWEIWPTLTAGGSLHFADEATRASPFSLREWMAEERISVAFLPTPWVELLLSRDWPEAAVPSLRVLLTGGDRLNRFSRPLSFELVNNYGPTEATVVTTSGALAPGAGRPHIGRPIREVRVHILDESLRSVPSGDIGELYIAGRGLARGYLGDPARTAERFLPDPFGAGERMFRSGDRVRLRPDGNLEFVGRIDEQIKLHGFRIEPGEIEAALATHPAVLEAAVIVSEDPRRLVAYLVCADTVEDDLLCAHLAKRLPKYMIPSTFVRWPSLPRTPNGKIDRRVLPK